MNRAIFVRVRGKPLQVFIGADYRFYLYDPTHHLEEFEHGPLPTNERVVSDDGRLGTSTAGSIAETVIPAALSFVPVVGPILGPIAGFVAPMIGNLFGGNDPTPRDKLVQDVVLLRTAIFNARVYLGIPDQMPVLVGRPNHWDNATAIIRETFPNGTQAGDVNHFNCPGAGVNCSGCGNYRKCLYATIHALNPIAQALTQQANTAQLNAQIQTQVQAQLGTQPGAIAPSVSAPASSSGGMVDSGGMFMGPGGLPANAVDTSGAVSSPALANIASSFGGTLLPLLLVGGLVVFSAVQGKKQNAPTRRRAA